MPEEIVDPTYVADAHRPTKTKKKTGRPKRVRVRRMSYFMSAATSMAIRDCAKYIRRPRSWVYPIVAAKLAAIENLALEDLMNEAIEKLRSEALRAKLIDYPPTSTDEPTE